MIPEKSSPAPSPATNASYSSAARLPIGVSAWTLAALHRELQILEHQRRREAALIVAVGRGLGTDAGDRAIARHRPALARADRGDVVEFLRIEPELLGERERLAGRDHRRA